MMILTAVTAVCAYGFYRVGKGNLEKRYVFTHTPVSLRFSFISFVSSFHLCPWHCHLFIRVSFLYEEEVKVQTLGFFEHRFEFSFPISLLHFAPFEPFTSAWRRWLFNSYSSLFFAHYTHHVHDPVMGVCTGHGHFYIFAILKTRTEQILLYSATFEFANPFVMLRTPRAQPLGSGGTL